MSTPSFSTYEANRLQDASLGGATYTPVATYYVALMTSMPTAAGGGTEATGGSYARVAVTNNSTNFPAAVGGAKGNGTVISYAQITASIGTIVGVALYDALTGGNLIRFALLNTPKATATNDTINVSINAFQFTLV